MCINCYAWNLKWITYSALGEQSHLSESDSSGAIQRMHLHSARRCDRTHSLGGISGLATTSIKLWWLLSSNLTRYLSLTRPEFMQLYHQSRSQTATEKRLHGESAFCLHILSMIVRSTPSEPHDWHELNWTFVSQSNASDQTALLRY
jgi:hypothetical protein